MQCSRCYHCSMTTDPGVLTPTSVNSPAISGTNVNGPLPGIFHNFANVIRDLLAAHVFPNENAKLSAMRAVDAFEKANVPVNAFLNREGDRAPVEDVSKRVPPGGNVAVVLPQSTPAIDYDRLAAALMAAQTSSQNAGGQ